MIKKTKYKAIQTTVNGVKFGSRKEANRYQALTVLLGAGIINDLRLQVPYKLFCGDVVVCKYVADFVYFDTLKNSSIVEDVKGFKTPVYRLKKKIMKACYGIDILET